MFSSNLLYLSSDLIPSAFPTKICYEFLIPSMLHIMKFSPVSFS
jgi:hypothetical protein